MFVDRECELIALKDIYSSNKPEFIVVYGRRRVGKTELITRFGSDKNHVYLLATYQSEKDVIRKFSIRVAESFRDELILKNPYEDWDSFFQYLWEKVKDKRVVVIFDEFPYLIQQNKALPSILQQYWDEKLSKTKIFLILCGSSISMMENEVLGYRSPLYGRRTGQMKIEPLSFKDAIKFFQPYKFVDKIRGYSIVGGIPAYLLKINSEKNIVGNIVENFIVKEKFLYGEALFLLREELKEPRTYFSILKSIASGKRKLNDIVLDSTLERNVVGKYLDILRDLRIVDRLVPVTEKHPEKSKRGLYIISDYYLKFWFTFIHPNMDYIDSGKTEKVKDLIMENLDAYVSRVFEDVCIELLKDMSIKGRLPMEIERIGSWWDGKEEIDIVAINEKTNELLVGEAKWSNKPAGLDVFHELKRKADLIPIKGKRYFTLFSRAGFANSVKAIAKAENNIYLYDLNTIEKVLMYTHERSE